MFPAPAAVVEMLVEMLVEMAILLIPQVLELMVAEEGQVLLVVGLEVMQHRGHRPPSYHMVVVVVVVVDLEVLEILESQVIQEPQDREIQEVQEVQQMQAILQELL
jgi:hypothetical protein